MIRRAKGIGGSGDCRVDHLRLHSAVEAMQGEDVAGGPVGSVETREGAAVNTAVFGSAAASAT